MATDRTIFSSAQAPGSATHSASPFGQCYLLSREERVLLAPAAQVLSSMEDGLRPLSQVVPRRNLASHQSRFACLGTNRGRPRRRAFGGRARQSNHSLRGTWRRGGLRCGKKTKGRKRFIIVDTLGLLLGVVVVPASVPERMGAQGLLEPLLPALGTLRKLWVDGGKQRTGIRRSGPPAISEAGSRGDQAVRRCSGVQRATQALGCGGNVCVAGTTSAIGSGLRENRVKRGRLDRHCSYPDHVSSTGFIGPSTDFSDGLRQ